MFRVRDSGYSRISKAFAPPGAFTADSLVVTLEDGRILSVPLEWFPRLRDASPKARRNWRLIAKGYGIHWPTLDEDISVPGLLGLPD